VFRHPAPRLSTCIGAVWYWSEGNLTALFTPDIVVEPRNDGLVHSSNVR
jgi:hypothetical protein